MLYISAKPYSSHNWTFVPFAALWFLSARICYSQLHTQHVALSVHVSH